LPNKAWANYPLGVFAQFIKRGVAITQGYDILFRGNVPAGAGLSSSAAMEVVTAYALNELLGTKYGLADLAKIGRAAEHEFAGVMCGIMDQFASAHGKADHAIYLNCDTLEYDLVPVKLEGIKVVVTNTHSPHKLDSGSFNDRVRQCQLAVEQINVVRPIQYLAELSQVDFDQVKDAITDETAHRRARHVVGEVQRTKDAVEALKNGDIVKFGQLMNQSHVSLRDDYEVTGPQLDALAEAAWKIDGVLGSRMTGGGFGGCTVSLVREEAIPAFIEKVGAEYTEKTGLTADFYIAEIGDGAHRVI
jgi:galactokinase